MSFFRTILSIVLFGAGAAGAGLAAEIEPLPVSQVAPGIFVYQAPYALAARGNDGAIANVGFIVGDDAIAVVDTGSSLRAGRRLRAAIRERSALPIRYVINTHMHPDHVLGNAAFREDGPTFVGHQKLARALAARGQTYLDAGRRVMGEAAFAGTEIIAPDQGVEDVLTIDLGGRVLELKAHPTAHTDNDLTVLDLRTRTWFLGDLLFMGHVPTIDGSLLGWLSFLRDAKAESPERVVPGHGPASALWPEAAAPQERYLARLESDIRAMLDEGRTMQEAADRAGLSEREGWALFDEFNPRNAITSYHELEWE